MQLMPGGNLLIWSRLDPSVEEKRREDPSVEEKSSENDKAKQGCLLVDAVKLGQDGDWESHVTVQNVTVRGAAIPVPEPVYTPCGG
jgi:hypothetical protein